MARHYGIPYMGSKQKLVDKIVPFILKRHPEATDLYDLFGGGGSVSLYAVLNYPQITTHYNELSKAISALMIHLKDGGEIPSNFITRSEFEARWRDDDWYAGLLQTCWTFGNSTNGNYLYGRDIEEFKLRLHKVVFDGERNLGYLEDFVRDHFKREGVKLFLDFNRYTTPYQRRIVLRRQCADHRIQHLHYLDRLNHIVNMPGISELAVTNKSYTDVEISGEKPILFCDPPYEGTAEYRESGFDHKAFYDWASSQKYPVYFTSYEISDKRFTRVKAINTRSLLAASQTKTLKYNYENIYWNGVS